MTMLRTPREALHLARDRVRSSLAQAAREDIYPHAAPSATGVWTGKRAGMWSSGFWAGLLWQEAALSGRPGDVATAASWTRRLRPHLAHKTHDIGFVFGSSAVLGWEIGKDAACRDLALEAADRLAAMFQPAAGVIPIGSEAEVAAGLDDVTVDCMVNLPLLWWAWKVTGEERFVTVARSHADRTSEWHVKEDGRVIQSVHFDSLTGEKTREETHQGSGVDGCWSRGQAWAIYGFAAAYHATGETRYSEMADRTATYFFHRVGEHLVPFYCFDDPAIPDVPRDASAAAIACAGLWMLAQHVPDRVLQQRCRDRAEALLDALVTGCLTPEHEEDRRPPGMLLHSCYSQRARWDTDHEIVWGDYFLLESLRAWSGLQPH